MTERPDLRVALLLALCSFLIYNANGRGIGAGDTYPARYLPFAIWQHHTVYLDPVAQLTAHGRGDLAFWMVPLPDGHVISLYPVVVPLVVAPLYLPAIVDLHLRGWSEARVDYLARVMEKLSASFVTALSVALLYLLLRRRASRSVALLLTIAYAFGTTTWTISSQALWQHGVAELLVIATLLLVTSECTSVRAVGVGLLCGLIAANRPPDVILAAALGVYALWWAGRRRAVWLIASAALPAVLLLIYNLGVAGNVMGGYGVMGRARFFEHDLLAGIAGLLVSPARGLFVFSPFLLFVVLAWRHLRGLSLVMAVAVILQLLLYAKSDWRGGVSWGPRYMTDLLPFLMWMLVPVVAAQRMLGRALFVLAVAVSIAVEVIGAFWYTGVTDLPIIATPRGPHEMDAVWKWRNAPFVGSLQHGLAPAELLVKTRGSFDAIEVEGRRTSSITAGEPAVATGWALAGHETPHQVVVIVDGRQTVGTQTFFERPDVRASLHESQPAGWRVTFDTSALAAGQRHLTAFVWATEKGEGHFLDERTLTVTLPSPTASGAVVRADKELDDDFARAASRIAEHQQADGYWLTAFTSETRFHDPHPEMNTYMTALLVDLLDPIAQSSGLNASLQRARQHLTRQIEANGLVRYHGLPNAPGIGTLGCVITPDTDDTALAWRIAPAPDRARLASALATIDRYRTGHGLYRTWLAQRADYQCLDPGSDPDPTDIAIQMHLLLLLAEVRPAASRALCTAIRAAVDEDEVWVYYRRAPIVPILRLVDLHRAGCDIDLPESRVQAAVPGQRIWVTAARLLAQSPDAPQMRATLLALAKDDFALLRSEPPLLYHNDLTASVSRYYWSEDVGYALWLRLYDRYRHLRPHPVN